MSQFIKSVFLASCGIACGASYGQQANAPQNNKDLKVNWRLDTQSPLGGLGVNVGPQMIKPLSETSSLSGRATIGGALTFTEDPNSGVSKSTLSPSTRTEINYHYSFLKGRIRTSSGLSAAYVKVDNGFYGTEAIKGFSANLKGSIRLVEEATAFAEIRTPVSGNLPHSKTVGMTLTPFARAFQSLSGVQISLSHTESQFNYAEKQTMSINSAVAGYSWKTKDGHEFFAGGVCVDVTANKANGLTVKGQRCIPWASMAINLD